MNGTRSERVRFTAFRAASALPALVERRSGGSPNLVHAREIVAGDRRCRRVDVRGVQKDLRLELSSGVSEELGAEPGDDPDLGPHPGAETLGGQAGDQLCRTFRRAVAHE